MTLRRLAAVVLTVLAGLLGCAVTLHGVDAAHAIDFRFSPVLSILYCVLPLLSLPAYLLALKLPKLAPLLAILALAFLAVYSALNWRTCSALGYCGSVASTVLLTLKTPSVLAYFAMALCSLAAFFLRHPRH